VVILESKRLILRDLEPGDFKYSLGFVDRNNEGGQLILKRNV